MKQIRWKRENDDSYEAEGRRAYHQGWHRYDNPYDEVDHYAAILWFKGYDQELDEAIQ